MTEKNRKFTAKFWQRRRKETVRRTAIWTAVIITPLYMVALLGGYTESNTFPTSIGHLLGITLTSFVTFFVLWPSWETETKQETSKIEEVGKVIFVGLLIHVIGIFILYGLFTSFWLFIAGFKAGLNS